MLESERGIGTMHEFIAGNLWRGGKKRKIDEKKKASMFR